MSETPSFLVAGLSVGSVGDAFDNARDPGWFSPEADGFLPSMSSASWSGAPAAGRRPVCGAARLPNQAAEMPNWVTCPTVAFVELCRRRSWIAR